jgi:hypothetical protein
MRLAIGFCQRGVVGFELDCNVLAVHVEDGLAGSPGDGANGRQKLALQ